jgi:CDGSH-type Zn-finger protein
MYLCGCKLSKKAPFCDGETCQKLLQGQKFEIEDNLNSEVLQEQLQDEEAASSERLEK